MTGIVFFKLIWYFGGAENGGLGEGNIADSIAGFTACFHSEWPESKGKTPDQCSIWDGYQVGCGKEKCITTVGSVSPHTECSLPYLTTGLAKPMRLSSSIISRSSSVLWNLRFDKDVLASFSNWGTFLFERDLDIASMARGAAFSNVINCVCRPSASKVTHTRFVKATIPASPFSTWGGNWPNNVPYAPAKNAACALYPCARWPAASAAYCAALFFEVPWLLENPRS